MIDHLFEYSNVVLLDDLSSNEKKEQRNWTKEKVSSFVMFTFRLALSYLATLKILLTQLLQNEQSLNDKVSE